MADHRSSTVSPFGPELQRYWDKRYHYFSRFDSGIQIDEEGLYSVVPEAAALRQANHIHGARIVDGFAGVGGNTIGFARSGKQVTAIEIDPNRIEMARHNTELYGAAGRVAFITGDFFEYARDLEADTVYLDPPWGGPAYKELGRFLLEHFNPDGNAILAFSLERFHEIVLKVPTIFDMAELDRYPVTYEVLDEQDGDRVLFRTIFMQRTA